MTARAAAATGGFQIALVATAAAVLTAGLLRIALFTWFISTGDIALTTYCRMLITGLRFDLLAGLCFGLPQALATGLLSDSMAARPVVRRMFEATWLTGFLFLPLLVVCEWLFFEEFDSRLNYIAFEYLVYPTEICCNVWESYPVIELLTGVSLIGGALFALFRNQFHMALATPLTRRNRLGGLAVYLLATAGLGATTSMASAEVSQDRVINECAGNGLYSFVYYAWSCRFDYEHLYLTAGEHLTSNAVRKLVLRPDDQPAADSSNPFDRTVANPRAARPHNVVIILEESLGSDFVGVLGDNRNLTPRFDELARDGLLFDNIYATGNRTARALEAVLTSMPPLPTEAILKRDHSERVYTLANVLANRGYRRLFMTGGRGLFDGVRSFMTANGFDLFLEQSDYTAAEFTNAWGVSDEDLFRRTLVECDRLHNQGQPFLSVVLTVSNHRPFTFPAGRIPQSSPTRENAVRYADWALGEFFRKARTMAFYRHTLFVVMGDHGARVYGAPLFPLQSYRVPVLMIPPEGDFAGRRCHTLGSSLDIAPTVLGLLGGTYRSVFLGRDLLQLQPEEGYALMQHNHDLAMLRSDGELIVLGVQKRASSFRVDPATFALQFSGQPDDRSLLATVGFYQSAHRLYYSDRWFPDGRVD
ncbi:MAG: sulfatase-like hydrolase/transferase [Planctomycetaceae bacterium]|nr:sulfatase-like hydrolase/transferase [Planctomycetaceae bacterium]